MARRRWAWYRLKRVRISTPLFLAMLMVVVFVGWRLLMVQQSGLEALHATVVQANEMYTREQDALIELAQRLELSKTEEFIANEARTKHGFLVPGEIRYVVVNPEVLWDNNTPPPADDTP